MPEEKPPWLFIYFVPNIKVLKATNGQLWLCEIGTGNGIVLKLSTGLIPTWDKRFIALAPGFWWSGFLFRKTGVEQIFSPAGSRDIIFCIPEKYIARVYNMANRQYIYQYLPPNPPR